MVSSGLKVTQIVSPKVWDLILDSPHLRQSIVPQGLALSPYEILDYNATLTLHDERGVKATFQRTQKVRFLQQGVSAILDHAWGEGVLVANYHHSAGPLEDSFKDQGRRHMVIGLEREMGQGETLEFSVSRTAMEAFTRDEGVLETTIDHPVTRLRRSIIFPKRRAVRRAILEGESESRELPVIHLGNGGTMIRVVIPDPKAGVAYVIRWTW